MTVSVALFVTELSGTLRDVDKSDIKTILRAHSLRATAPRMALFRLLLEQKRPLSYSEVVAAFGDADWDPATVYRNLVCFADAGLARVVSRAAGMARYELVEEGDSDNARLHAHPHFACNDCGTVTCLPEDAVPHVAVSGPWHAAVAGASVQLQGSCPDCLGTPAAG